MLRSFAIVRFLAAAVLFPALLVVVMASLDVLGQDKPNYSVAWIGNSFPGGQDKWVQNFCEVIKCRSRTSILPLSPFLLNVPT